MYTCGFQKAAAALGNLAWRSEETRESISQIDGVMPGVRVCVCVRERKVGSR